MKTSDIDCPVRERINDYCSCPKNECDNHGLCCECIVAHKDRLDQPLLKRLPHCFREMVKAGLAES
jgi:hypothetical protein